MKVYFGRRQVDTMRARGRALISVRESDQTVRQLPHVCFHSPDGFEWGYGGSGPADSALSILADYFGESPSKSELMKGVFDDGEEVQCWKYHQRFKWDFLATSGKDSWEINEQAIHQFMERQIVREEAEDL